MEKINKYNLFFIILISNVLLLSGCYKFEGDQTVPAYIQIDTVLLNTNYYDQGSNSQNITDVWIYVDDELIGAFELPAKFPVLAQGQHKLEIRPGIKLNGISSTRVPYPFYLPITYNNFNFIPDSIKKISNPTTTYYPNLEFSWMEDFEKINLTLVENEGSDTVIVRTQPAGSPEAFLEDNSLYSGLISLTDEKPVWTALSYNKFSIPPQGSLVLLEMNFKTDNYLNMGLIVQENGSYLKVPLLVLNHSVDWTKIYINLGPNLSLHSAGSYYQIYFESVLESDQSTASIFIDNIKLVNRSIDL